MMFSHILSKFLLSGIYFGVAGQLARFIAVSMVFMWNFGAHTKPGSPNTQNLSMSIISKLGQLGFKMMDMAKPVLSTLQGLAIPPEPHALWAAPQDSVLSSA